MKKIVYISLLTTTLIACGGEQDNDAAVLENATAVAALSEGEEESIDEVPAGDPSDAAEEDVAAAEEDPVVPKDCSLPAVRARVIETYDIDGDGKLSEEERATLKEEFAPSPLKRRRYGHWFRFMRLQWVYDVDGSGDLSDEERAQLHADLETRCENRQAALLAAFDTDQDGALSDAEWQLAHDTMVERLKQHREERLAAYDDNDDGVLNDQERLRARAGRRARFEERRDAFVATHDTDGDGVLSRTEREEARKAIISRVRGEHFGD